MKKIFPLVLIGLILMSCGSHKKTTYNKRSKQKRVVRSITINENKDIKVKTIQTTTKKQKVGIDISKNKTKFSTQLLEDLYKDKPNLSKKKIDYIKKYGAIAIHEMENYKIPASITLAQGLLESRYGQSILTTNANNHFGIKCHKVWSGGKVYHDDDEKGECFRKYEHAESSFRDHSLFLFQRKRYADLFKLRPNDYKGWAKGLRKAGYATDKKYPEKLIKLIEEYELYYFDNLVLDDDFKEMEIVETKLEINNKHKTNLTYNKKNNDDDNKIFINRKQIHIVEAGETLYAISRANNISVEDLKKFNNLTLNDISVGQELKMYNPDIKQVNDVVVNKNIYKNYIVKQGDTIYSIAKKNNIKVSEIIIVNNLDSTKIAIGQVLKIKINNN
jgi:flagellum-specific peptidoglycan hydrolase FlgJ/LysM repeat protein